MIESSAASATAAAATSTPESLRERLAESRRNDAAANSGPPLSTERLLLLLAELKRYQDSATSERLEVHYERMEQQTRLAQLEQQLLAEEQIGQDLQRRIDTLEEAIRNERRVHEKMSQGGLKNPPDSFSRSSLLKPERVTPEVVAAYLERVPQAPVSCQSALIQRLREARIPLRGRQGDDDRGSEGYRSGARPSDHRPEDAEATLSSISWRLRQNIKAHVDAVRCVCVDESNTMLLSGGEDSLVKGWDLSPACRNPDAQFEWEPFVMLRAHHGPVLSLALRPQDRILFSAGMDSIIRAWTLPEGRPCEGLQLIGHKDSVWSLQHHAHLPCMASAGADGQIYLWNTEAQETSESRMQASFVLKNSGQPGEDVPSSTSWVPALTSQLLAGYTSGRLAAFDVRHGTQVLDLFPEGEPADPASVAEGGTKTSVTSVAAQQLNQLAAVGHADGRARLVDLGAGRCVGTVRHPDCVTSVMLDPTNAYSLLTGCHDGCLRIFDLRKFPGTSGVGSAVRPVQQLELHLRK